jgi:hypothetical protein
VTRLVPQIRHDETAEGVDAHVTCQNLSVGLVLQDGMQVL